MYILTKDEIYKAEKYTKEKIGLKEEILMEIEDKKGLKNYKSYR